MDTLKLKDVPDDMKVRIIRMLNTVWQYIGYDVLEGTKNGTIKRSDVIELVLDAGRPITHGDDEEAGRVLDKLSFTDQKKIAKEAFPYKTYC